MSVWITGIANLFSIVLDWKNEKQKLSLEHHSAVSMDFSAREFQSFGFEHRIPINELGSLRSQPNQVQLIFRNRINSLETGAVLHRTTTEFANRSRTVDEVRKLSL
jgi:hypothetical protein